MKLRIKRKEHGRFYCLMAILLLLVCCRYVLQIDIPREFFLAIIAVIALTGDKDEILAMCMCCIPLHESIDLFYAIVICMTFYVIKNYRIIHVGAEIALVLLLIIWELLHYLVQDFSLKMYLVNIIPLIVLLIVMSADVSQHDYAFTVRVMAVATVANCCMLLCKVLYWSDFNILKAFAGLQRLGIESEAISKNSLSISGAVNPNTLGIICVLATTALMQLRATGHGKRRDMWMSAILLVFGALTSSRTFLVCLLLMILLLIFSQKGSISRKIRFVGAMLAVLMLGFSVLYLLFPDLLQYYVGRFKVADITTGRSQLMRQYHNFIVTNPKILLWGIGLQDFGLKLLGTYRVATHVPHNGIQEMIIAWGIPGLILFGMLLLSMILRAAKHNKTLSLLNFIPLLIILAKSMAGQLVASSYTMLALSYAYLSLSQDFCRTEEQTP